MPSDAFEGDDEPVKFDPADPINEEENDLGGRINSQLPFEEALKILLKSNTEDVAEPDKE